MTTMPATEPLTAQEYMAMPELERRPTNLIDGELVMSEPTERHREVLLRLVLAVANWVNFAPDRGKASLPIDVLVDDRNVYAPDVLWYAPGRTLPDPETRPYPVPDLAAEIRSPSTWRYDVGAKKDGYERARLRELWLVDTPAREVLVFRRSTPDTPRFDVSLQLAEGEAVTSPQLPRFALLLTALFAD